MKMVREKNEIDPRSTAQGDRLRMIRLELQLARPAFAKMLGIPVTTLKNYELGYREVGIVVPNGMYANDTLRPYIAYLLSDAAAEDIFKRDINN